MPRRVLVTGVGGASGMYTAKILKESGYYVVGTDINGYAAGSVLCDEFCVVDKASNREYFVRDISRLIERFDIDVVLPNVDEELPVFSEEGLRAIISNKDAIYACVNKYMFYNTLQHMFQLPYTALVCRATWDKFDGKVIVKPIYGRGSKDIYVFDNIRKVVLAEVPLDIRHGYIVQNFVEGKEITVDVLVGKGSNFFAYPRYRLCTYGGVSQVGRTVLHKKVIEISHAVCDYLCLYGPVNIQFIEEVGTGELYLTEINPRLSGGIGITYANGANIPSMAISEHFGDPYEIPEVTEGVVFRVFEEYRDENPH